ncbi:MAG TPA: hypothetical protein V6C88_11275 [Chroococcidiopsis sp.]
MNIDDTASLDWILGGLAIAILVGGMLLLFKGVFAMGNEKK